MMVNAATRALAMYTGKDSGIMPQTNYRDR